MADFVLSYWASILATVTLTAVTGIPALVYSFRDRLIQRFWELSEDYVQELVPTRVETVKETELREVVTHERTSFRLSLNRGGSELDFDPPHGPSITLRLVQVGSNYVDLKDLSVVQRVYPYAFAETSDEGKRVFRIEANEDQNLRGKLIGFQQNPIGVSMIFVHAENANSKEGRATIVVDSFSGKVDSDYDQVEGLG